MPTTDCPRCGKPLTTRSQYAGGGWSYVVDVCEWCDWHGEVEKEHEDQ